MKFFYSVTDHRDATFRKYAGRYADSNDMPCSTEADYSAIFNSLVDMESFNSKGPVPKNSRWYAWWDGYVFHIHDLWGLKMIIEVNFETLGADFQLFRPDRFTTPEAELRALKSAAGGFRLAYKVITHELDFYARGLFVAGSACWEAHSARARDVKSPQHGLVNFLKQSRGGWKNEVLAIAHNSFASEDLLDRMGLLKPLSPEPFDGFANAQAMLTLHLMGMRAWSLKLDYEMPPTRYSSTLDANSVRRNASVAQMQRDFSIVVKLEADALTNSEARALRKQIWFLHKPTVRLAFLLLERAGGNPRCPKFQRIMRRLHEIVPDSRIVEDCANPCLVLQLMCRMAHSRACSSKFKLTPLTG